MKLPPAPDKYDKDDQASLRRALTEADQKNRKTQRDIELTVEHLILSSPNGTRYYLTVSNGGTLGTTAL